MWKVNGISEFPQYFLEEKDLRSPLLQIHHTTFILISHWCKSPVLLSEVSLDTLVPVPAQHHPAALCSSETFDIQELQQNNKVTVRTKHTYPKSPKSLSFLTTQQAYPIQLMKLHKNKWAHRILRPILAPVLSAASHVLTDWLIESSLTAWTFEWNQWESCHLCSSLFLLVKVSHMKVQFTNM